MKLKMLLGMLVFGLMFTACPSGDDDDSAAGDDDDVAGDDDDATGGFIAGQFQFTTVGVTDSCTDGALEAIYLPGGPGTTSDWQYPIEMPAFEDCPAQVSIQLQAPFNDMDVTIDSPGADQFSISGEENQGVVLTFLEEHREFKVIEPADMSGVDRAPFTHVFPDTDRCDGTFAAALRRME